MQNRQGNTAGNINNMGLVSIQDGWIYFLGVYRGREDGSGFTVINDDNMGPKAYVNVVGDWMYYQDAIAGGGIYKVRADKDFEDPSSGWTKPQQLNSDQSVNLTVVDDWIYYINKDKGNKIHKIRTDGTNNQQLNSDDSDFINVVDGWIYYANLGDSNRKASGCIYKMRTDGTGRQKISDDDGCFINVVDGWVYYGNASKGHTLWKMKPDGSDNQLQANGMQGSFWNIVGNLAYCRVTVDSALTKLELNGDRGWTIRKDETVLINVVGDWIYYADSLSPFSKICKIRTDGTDHKALTG